MGTGNNTMSGNTKRLLGAILALVYVLSMRGLALVLIMLTLVGVVMPTLAAVVPGDPTKLAGVAEAAAAVERAADGSLVKMLVIAVIVLGSVLAMCMQLMLRGSAKPCLLQTDMCKAVIRELMWGVWNDMRRELGK